MNFRSIVFRPGPVAGPGQFFFLNQNDVVLVKKNKINELQPSF